MMDLMQLLVPPVYAACDNLGAAGDGNPANPQGINLSDCFLLNGKDPVSNYFKTPSDIVNLVVNNIFIFGGFILMAMIMVAGFQFLTGGSKGKDAAKKTITNAVIGFIVMFSAYWILQIVRVITGTQINI